jgi:hypothetical protein
MGYAFRSVSNNRIRAPLWGGTPNQHVSVRSSLAMLAEPATIRTSCSSLRLESPLAASLRSLTDRRGLDEWNPSRHFTTALRPGGAPFGIALSAHISPRRDAYLDDWIRRDAWTELGSGRWNARS